MATDLTTATPTNPFFALNPHFGLLLGVEDLFTLQGYAAGKTRLHNAWLHRAGVVWGMNVEFNASQELQVDQGFALDGLGRELHVDNPQCVDLTKWYAEALAGDLAGLPKADSSGQVKLDLTVVACFNACLSKAVPAIADTCGTPASSIAYSRITETVQVQLKLGPAPAHPAPYHKLRVLFGLEAPLATDADVTAARNAVIALPGDQQPAALVDAFRRFAALDGAGLVPAQGPTNPSYPEAEPGCVVLAEVSATLMSKGGGWVLLGSSTTPAAADPGVDLSVRTALVPTATIQELLCGPFGASASGSAPPPPADAGGPRFDPAQVALTATTLTLKSTGTLLANSVDRDAFTLHALLPSGWAGVDLKSASLDAARTTVTLELKEQPLANSWLRLVVSGTGATPLLGDVGTDLVPLAGELGGAPGTKTQGNDFIHFWKVS